MTRLSRREMQVAQRLERGLNGRQIAADLGVGYEAVRNYLRRARRKLGVHTQRDIVALSPLWREVVSDHEELTLP